MAKTFRFRLETVQRLRMEARDRQQRAVADAASVCEGTEKVRRALDVRLRENVEQMRLSRTHGVLDVALMRAAHLHSGWLSRRMAEVDLELKDRRTRLAIERKKLTEAMAKLKAIEKLRERQWRRHQLETDREEQAVLDETAIRNFTAGRHRSDAREAALEGAVPLGDAGV